MHPEFNTQTHDNTEPAYLLITDSEAQTSTVTLEQNSSIFAGAGSNCRIVLIGDDVYPIHCMLWLDEQRTLRVQDWNTGGRTQLNGRSIDEEAVLNSGDELRIGSNMIVPVLSPELHARVTSQLAISSELTVPEKPIESAGSSLSQEPSLQETPDEPTTETMEADESNQVHSEPPGYESKESEAMSDDFDAATRLAPEDSGYVYEFDEEFEEDLSDSYDVDAHTLADEEVRSLRLEVEQLRYEVAERDAQIRMLSEQQDQETDSVEDEQTVQLVMRLEELLNELKNSDDRVRGLEELLQVSDEAIQAEQEERRQLESWVTEIEQRVAQREAEAEAEKNRMLKQLKEARTQHKHARSQLQKALQLKGTGPSGSSNEILQKFSEQVADLQRQLEAANQENEKSRKQNLDTEKAAKAQDELQQMEQKMLQLEIETSRERAELARERVQLERVKDELEQKLNSNRELGDADSRIQAMREHLRDIHEQEKTERDERKQQSLSGRISRLLSRVGS